MVAQMDSGGAAERDAQFFKAAMVDDKLAIAGELTRQEVVEHINPLRASTRARRMCIPSERGQAKNADLG